MITRVEIDRFGPIKGMTINMSAVADLWDDAFSWERMWLKA